MNHQDQEDLEGATDQINLIQFNFFFSFIEFFCIKTF